MDNTNRMLPYASPPTSGQRTHWAVRVSFVLTGIAGLGFAGLAALWTWGPSHGRTGDEQMGASIALFFMSLPLVAALLVSAIFSVVGLVQSRGSWPAWLAAALACGPFVYFAAGVLWNIL